MLLLVQCGALAVAHAQDEGSDGWLTRPHAPVRGMSGDDPAWSDPSFDDGAWPVVASGASPRGFADPTRTGLGWYRVRLAVPEGEPVGLLFGDIADIAQVFVDGELLHTHGDPAARVAGEPIPFAVVVPDRLTTDGAIVIAVRAWGGPPGQRVGLFPGLHVGDPVAATLAPHTDVHVRWRDARGAPTLGLSLGMVGLGLLHAWLWGRRRDPEQGFFGLGATLLGVSLGWRAWLQMGNAVPWVRLEPVEHLLLGGATAGMLAFVSAYLGRPGSRSVHASVALLAVGAAIGLFEPGPPLAVVPYVGYAAAALSVLALIVAGLWNRTATATLAAVAFGPALAWAFTEGAYRLTGAPEPWAAIRAWALIGAVGWLGATLSLRLTAGLADTLDELDATARAAARFVPDAVLRLLGRTRISDVQRGDSIQQEMEVLSCDIRGFTTLSESRSPARNFAFINDFLAAMEPCVTANGGFLALNLGDGFLALFPRGEASAIGAGVAMQRALVTFNEAQRAAGEPAIRVGIGVHAGPVMLGTIGGRDRLDTGIVSNAVGVAEQMEGQTRLFDAPLVVSRDVLEVEVARGWATLELDQVDAAGYPAPLAVFEVLDAETDPVRRAQKLDQAEGYAEGLARFRAGDLEGARRAFAALPEREAAALFVARCDWLLARGLPKPWNGVMQAGLQ